MGYGPYSTTTEVLTDDVPAPMDSPVLLMVRSNYVIISWTSVTDFQLIGRDQLKYYSVWWDQGTGVYVKLTTDSN